MIEAVGKIPRRTFHLNERFAVSERAAQLSVSLSLVKVFPFATFSSYFLFVQCDLEDHLAIAKLAKSND